MTPADLAEALPILVPFVGTLGITYERVAAEGATLHLEDRPAFRNHVDAPHAGALFTLAESASGAVVVAGFGHLLGRVTPVVARSEIRYLKPAQGSTTAQATPEAGLQVAVGEAEAGRRSTVMVAVVIADSHEMPVARASFDWVLLPNG